MSVNKALESDHAKLQGKQWLAFERTTAQFEQLIDDCASILQMLLYVDERERLKVIFDLASL